MSVKVHHFPPSVASQSQASPPRGAQLTSPGSSGSRTQTAFAETVESWPSVAQTWPVAPGAIADLQGSTKEDGRETPSPVDRPSASATAPVGRVELRDDAAEQAPDGASSATGGGRDVGGGVVGDEGAPRGGPTEGDVYLDGERVGRWMARHLARELGGPQGASTGFDTRMGPAWPGSLHGN